MIADTGSRRWWCVVILTTARWRSKHRGGPGVRIGGARGCAMASTEERARATERTDVGWDIALAPRWRREISKWERERERATRPAGTFTVRKVRRPLTCFCLFICSKGGWGSIGRYFVLQTETILIHDGPIHLAFLKRGARPWSPCRHAKRGIHPYFHLLVSLLGRCGFNALARDVGTGILRDHSWWMDQAFIVMDDNRLIPVESGKKHRSTHAHRYTHTKKKKNGSMGDLFVVGIRLDSLAGLLLDARGRIAIGQCLMTSVRMPTPVLASGHCQ